MRVLANSRPMHLFFAVAISLFIFLASGANPAMASSEILEKYKKAAALYDIELSYGDVEELGNGDFKAHDVVLTLEGVEDQAKIRSITFKGVKELNGNGLSAELITFSGVSVSTRDEDGKDVFFTVTDGIFTGLYLPDPSDADAPLFNYGDTRVEINNVQVDLDGEPRMNIPQIISQSQFNEEERLMGVKFHMNNIDFFVEKIKDEEVRENLKAIGIEKFKMDINAEGEWNAKSGDLDITRYELNAQDMGSLNMKFKFGGYTEELAKDLRNTGYTIQKLPVEERGQASAESLEKLANLTFTSAQLIFTDSSITNRLLEMQAKSSGQTADDLKVMVPFMISGTLGDFLPEALTAKLTDAVKNFLAKPGSLSISAKPDTPMLLGEAMALGASVPAILLDKLNLDAVAQ